MVPRLLIDASWRDLASYFRATFADQTSACENLEGLLAARANRKAVAGLSVRTLFDALLSELAFDPGDEILMSAVTIENMAAIVTAHGLVPVPVDLDLKTLSPDMVKFEEAISVKTRMIVVAQLYGGRVDLAQIARMCHSKNLLLVEDMAQAFDGNYFGSSHADFNLMSFGPIKRRTALAGGILLTDDKPMAGKLRNRLVSLPSLSKSWYRKRILKITAVKAISQKWLYALFLRAIKMLGRDPDDVIGRAARGFKGDWLSAIRHRPPGAVFASMKRQLDRAPNNAAETARVNFLKDAVGDHLKMPGQETDGTGTWIFPVMSANRDDLIPQLRKTGVDATTGATSMRALPVSAGKGSNENAELLMDEVVYLPVHAGVTNRDIKRIAEVLAKEPYRNSAPAIR